jgi:hypothetical protein
LSFAPVSENFTCYFVSKDGPRDRAVSVRSKEALIQIRRESSKQLPLADRPFRRATQEIVTEIAEVFPEILGTVSESLNYVERLGKREEISQPKQEPLPNSVSDT